MLLMMTMIAKRAHDLYTYEHTSTVTPRKHRSQRTMTMPPKQLAHGLTTTNRGATLNQMSLSLTNTANDSITSSTNTNTRTQTYLKEERVRERVREIKHPKKPKRKKERKRRRRSKSRNPSMVRRKGVEVRTINPNLEEDERRTH